MGPEEIVKAMVSAAIAVIVPGALKQFWPEPELSDTTPWFAWVVAGLIGGALGGIASGALGAAGGGVGNWAALGASVGLMQWVALRGYRPVGVWFVFASAIGWPMFVLGEGLQNGAGWVIAGVSVGILQSLSLARWSGAFWWIPANGIGWLIAGWVGIVVGLLLHDAPVLAWIAGWAVAGLVGHAILLAPLTLLKSRQGETRQPA